MDKRNHAKIDQEVKELQKLISWHEYYSAIDNVFEANKCQKEIELKKRDINELRKAYGIPKGK
jgi:hypothetical protein